MSFGFSEEQAQWWEAMWEFARRECPPEYSRECASEGRPPTTAFRAMAKRSLLGVAAAAAASGWG
jgi:hypothetical protein